ncbi:MAG: 16S rRNA (adenine(1518)-N(6)/adenine(1519)-N(6))-dimethyltransferase RsmA [Bacteroidota bacterium]
MGTVRPKKHLGQHFLKDKNIAERIVDSLTQYQEYGHVLEIGPGTGVLTDFLVQKADLKLTVIDIDRESIAFLKEKYAGAGCDIKEGDFLKFDPQALTVGKFGIIGNFPYNISSQIFFKILEMRSQVHEVVGMIQKEVGDRIVAKHGNKTYGILSVLLQAYYDIEYKFTVEPGVFHPPPKVRSAVIRLKRNDVEKLDCDEKLFQKVVKQGFQNRRKTLRNALKPLNLAPEIRELPILDKRAEQLAVADFVDLTQKIQNS